MNYLDLVKSASAARALRFVRALASPDMWLISAEFTRDLAGRQLPIGNFVQFMPAKLDCFERLGVSACVEKCLTNDAQEICATSCEADRRHDPLRSCRLMSGEAPFGVERSEPERSLYLIDLEGEAAENKRVIVDGLEIHFDDGIELHARGTGAHIPDGAILAKTSKVLPRLLSYEIFELKLSHCGSGRSQKSDIAEFA